MFDQAMHAFVIVNVLVGLVCAARILFGTAWVPGQDEYPATGLDPQVRVDVVDSVIWPFRHLRRSLKYFRAERASLGSRS